ncbi:MAG: peptidase S41 [Flavobacteriales bacterium]|nr:peptidase S41 [Flavobacteriales bacterium]|tara:strand:+ start:57751 stop:59379 length:1629 start_codon:yes stop_codon:yes gene_type:complete
MLIKKFIYILSFLFLFNSLNSQSNYFEISKNLEIFNNVYKELNTYYVDDTEPGKLMKEGIDAMLKKLDPYTQYIPESEIEDFRFQTTGQYGGIGSLIRKVGDYVIIAEPYKDFPADKSGLKIGDKIIKIDGISMKDKSVEDVSKLLKGEPGKKVNISVSRISGSDIFEIPVTREKIKISSVPYSGLIDDIGYVKLNKFTRNCANEVKNEILKLESEKALKGIIIDLRMNPGGLLNEAIKLCNIFIEKNTKIVETKGRNTDWNKVYKTKSSAYNTEIPVVVLVNQGSASASEIFAGTLQDLDRGIVVGTKTFGKGLVQQTRKLNYNSQLKLTVAKYYTPSGRCIQEINYSDEKNTLPDSLRTEFKTKNKRSVFDGGGVDPDIIVETDSIPKIIFNLVQKQLIFKFGNYYSSKVSDIGSMNKFKITDEIYDLFKEFLKREEFQFETLSDEKINDLEETLLFEGYDIKLKETGLLKKIKEEILQLKNQDINKYKKDISKIILSDIIVRYYYNEGRIESSLKEDAAILDAIKILNDTKAYNKILNK